MYSDWLTKSCDGTRHVESFGAKRDWLVTNWDKLRDRDWVSNWGENHVPLCLCNTVRKRHLVIAQPVDGEKGLPLTSVARYYWLYDRTDNARREECITAPLIEASRSWGWGWADIKIPVIYIVFDIIDSVHVIDTEFFVNMSWEILLPCKKIPGYCVRMKL